MRTSVHSLSPLAEGLLATELQRRLLSNPLFNQLRISPVTSNSDCCESVVDVVESTDLIPYSWLSITKRERLLVNSHLSNGSPTQVVYIHNFHKYRHPSWHIEFHISKYFDSSGREYLQYCSEQVLLDLFPKSKPKY